MKISPIVRNIGFMAIFGLVGLTRFTEDVRTVQVLGLFASGALFGMALASLIMEIKAKRTPG